jgi:hypothetical protein
MGTIGRTFFNGGIQRCGDTASIDYLFSCLCNWFMLCRRDKFIDRNSHPDTYCQRFIKHSV